MNPQTGTQTDLDYVTACLIVPEPTVRDPDVVLPFALPSATDAKVRGTEQHWTPADLDAARRFLTLEEDDR